MRHSNDRQTPAAFLARMLLACTFCLLLPLRAVASPAADDIVVVAVKGDVQVTSGGATEGARAGSTLNLPAAIRTGHDGSIDLRQGDTTIGVGPGTQLDFPAPTTSGGPIERIAQPLGNAYYNVGPRGNRRLRVETPYLVAVIKGTQFNVAVTPDSSTISLHEGQLQVLATESGIAAVELNAGEIAIRHSGEKTIRVLRLKNGAASSAASSAGNGGETTTALVPSGKGDQGPEIPDDGSPLADEVDEDFAPGNPGSPTSPADASVTVDVDGGADAGVDLGAGAVDAGVDAGAGTVDAAVDAGVDLGAPGVDAAGDVGADLGAGPVDAGVDADVAGTDVGADIGVDLTGSDAGLDLDVDLSGADIDLGLGGDAAGSDGAEAPENDDSGSLLGGIPGRPGF